jgi:hypothetical protein
MFLSAASTGANALARRKQEGARRSALSGERRRQAGFDREIGGLNTRSQDRYLDFAGQEAETAKRLGDYLAAQSVVGPTDPNVMAPSRNAIVTREAANRSADAAQFVGQQGRALGTMRAFGDLLGDIGLQQGRDASQIGQLAGFKRASTGILPFELEAAAQRGKGLQTLADILAAASQVTGNIGSNPALGKQGVSARFGDIFNRR